MHKIIVKNSVIIVTDYELGENPKLESSFKIFDNLTHSYKYLAIEYDELNKILYLPRGTDIWYIERVLECKAYIDHNYDKYDKINPIYIKTLPRDDRQRTALRFMLSAKEFKHNQYKSQYALNLPTGAGKTYISVATAAYLEIKTIIITYSNQWLVQWKERIISYTNIKDEDICRLDSKIILMILNNKSKNINKKIYLVTHSTIKSYGDKNGWDKIGELFSKLKIGLKFYDEAHLNFENICRIDFHTNTYMTYYITATLERSDQHENTIYQLYFKNIPSINLFDEDNDPHTHYIALKFNSRPSPQQLSACKSIYGLNRIAYIDYLVSQPNFYKILYIALNTVLPSLKYKDKVLIYIGTNNAINIVKTWLESIFPELIGNIGIYTSQIDKVHKRLEKEKTIILSTTKSAGAAEDISNLKFTILAAEPFKSKVIAKQTLGRTRQDGTFYIELVDIGFFHIKNYFQYKLDVYKQYALSINISTFTQFELDNKVIELNNKRSIVLSPVKFVNNVRTPVSIDIPRRAPIKFLGKSI